MAAPTAPAPGPHSGAVKRGRSSTDGEPVHRKQLSEKKKLKAAIFFARKEKEEAQAAATAATKRPKPPCKYFLQGRCSNGDSCAFGHPSDAVVVKELCRHFAAGHCERGGWPNFCELGRGEPLDNVL